MKKKGFMKWVVAAVVAVTTCVGFTGCMDDVKDVSKGKETEKPNDFDFSTKKSVEFTLKYNVPVGYRVHVEMYSKSPITLDAYKSYVKDSTLVPFFSGKADENGKITYKGDLPATINEIYAYCSGFGMPTLMKASVSDAGVVSNFEVTPVPKASTTRANDRASGTNYWKTYNVKLEKPSLASVKKAISEEDKNLIEKSFPSNQVYDQGSTYYRPHIEFLKDAKVKIYSVSNGLNSERTNALAYFTFENNNVTPETANLQLIYPELTKTIPAEGDGYQLLYNGGETFKAGSSLAFALFPDITPNSIATNNAHLFYSCFNDKGWNSYNYPSVSADGGLVRANAPHMVLSLLRTDGNGHAIIAIAFEDQPWAATHGTNKGDFRDDIFILEIDPASSLPDLPTPPEEEPDYDSEFNYSGILCFEDSWPNKGDYDLNDVVISYDRNLYGKNGVGLVAIKETYTFLNNGASFSNGFGYQFVSLKKSDIRKCTVTSDYKCEGQGLDASLNDDATVMLFDNGKSVKKGTTFVVYTTISNGMSAYALQQLNNPFIVVNGNGSSNGILSQGRMEVHLPTPAGQSAMKRYLPTKKANTTYWGTLDDKSDPAKNIYYVRQGNYPFALQINWDSSKLGSISNFKFVIPQETASIEKTYPKFTNWVNSNGKNDTDWYLHPNK